jgi:hypothetical protein
MTADTMIKASEIRRIQHDEAMAITAVENRRLWELLIKIKPRNGRGRPSALGGTFVPSPSTSSLALRHRDRSSNSSVRH